ncbi:hypothetical protein FDK38_001414 [Candidozyma auris]|nr:hypothetical protein FDK38_001414 [[Candida] auris]
MTTFQTNFCFGQLPEKKHRPFNPPVASAPFNASANNDFGSSPSSNSSSQEDLLPDLWSEPAQKQLRPDFVGFHNPLVGAPMNMPVASPTTTPFGAQPQHQQQYLYNGPNPAFAPGALVGGQATSVQQAPRTNPNPLLSQVQQTSMMREASLEYAQSLLPHSLLAPLTEENLDLNSQRSSGLSYGHLHMSPTDELLNFEQQQAQKQAAPRPQARSLDMDLKSKKASTSSISSLSSDNEHHHHCHKSRHTSVSSTHSGSPKQKNINTQLYKTELCVSYMKMGVCPYGSKCQFAHGEDDLKTVERPANWRSKPCANWAKFGSCRYGKRCCFKHGD